MKNLILDEKHHILQQNPDSPVTFVKIPSDIYHQSNQQLSPLKNSHHGNHYKLNEISEVDVTILCVIGLLTGLYGLHRLYIGDNGGGLRQLFLGIFGYLLFGWICCYAIPWFFARGGNVIKFFT